MFAATSFDPSISTIALLALVGFLAGSIDAVAGGGGLVTLPALLFSGLSPAIALGTNKGQSFVGTTAAAFRFLRAGHVSRGAAVRLFATGAAGSLAGAWLQTRVPAEQLRPLVVGLLVAAFVLFLVAPAIKPLTGPRRPRLAAVLSLALGGYDGFFGPGTGTLLVIGFVAFDGAQPAQASAEAKFSNLGSNIAALAVFAGVGTIAWPIALPMALGQVGGGWLGSSLAIRFGGRLIRPLVLVVVAALILKLGFDLVSR